MVTLAYLLLCCLLYGNAPSAARGFVVTHIVNLYLFAMHICRDKEPDPEASRLDSLSKVIVKSCRFSPCKVRQLVQAVLEN